MRGRKRKSNKGRVWGEERERETKVEYEGRKRKMRSRKSMRGK